MKYYDDMVNLLERAYNLYRTNFYPLIIMSAIQSLIGLYSYFYKPFQENTGLQFLLVSVLMVLTYFNLRLGVTMILFLNDRNNNNQSSWHECYKKSNENIWKYIGAIFMLGIIVGIPIILLAFGFVYTSSGIFKIIIVLLGTPIALFLFAHFFFAPIISILNPEIDSSLNTSFELVKNARTSVFYFVLAIIILQFIPIIFFKTINSSGIIINGIEAITYLLIAPLISAFTLLFYMRLIKNSDAE